MKTFKVKCLGAGLFVFTSVSFGQQGWFPQTSPVGDPLAKIYFANVNEGWISTEGGVVLHTTNGGTTWSIQDPEPVDTITFVSNPASSMSFINATTGWVIGIRGQLSNPSGAVLYKTTNGGSSWTRQNLTPWTNGFAIQFIDASNGWAVVATGTIPNISGAIIRTTDGGVSWSTGYTTNHAAAIPFFLNANNGWMIRDTIAISGQGANLVCPCEILSTTNGGSTWSMQLRDLSPGGYEAMRVVDLSNAWVVGDSGKVIRTTNGGSSWAPVTIPNMVSGSKNKAAYFLDANNGWIGGSAVSAGEAVFHTTNAGATWSTQSPPVTYSIFDIYFVDANNGWLCADSGNIAHTTNGGVSSVLERRQDGMAQEFVLDQNYPNPFNPATTIRFALPKTGKVSLKIFNLLGQEIETLVDGQRPAGTYTVQWKPENLSSGVYVYRLQTEGFVEIKKLVLMK